MKSSDMICGLSVLTLLAGILFLTGCQESPVQDQTDDIRQSISVEDLTVELAASSGRILTSEMLTLEIVVVSDEDTRVSLPDFDVHREMWGDFHIFDRKSELAKLDENGQLIRHWIFTLEPEVAGDTQINSIVIKGERGGGDDVRIKTDPVPVTVTSVLDGDDTEIRDIAPNDTAQEEVKESNILTVLLIGNAVVVIGVLLVWLFRNEKPATADDAYSAFQHLKKSSASDIMEGVELAVCCSLQQRLGLSLYKKDFAGLEEALGENRSIDGLKDAISRYEQLQYSTKPASNEQVRELAADFDEIISRAGKETGL